MFLHERIFSLFITYFIQYLYGGANMLEGLNIGLGITGSFCNFPRIKELINNLKKEKVNKIIPIVSQNSKTYDTRFYVKDEFLEMLREETGQEIIDNIVAAEPIGPKNMIDIMVIVPCTGNTVAKLASGITDTAVLMATKGHIRNNKPVVIGISTNDGLGANFKNIGLLYDTKNFYFVPFTQDDYEKKPKSLVLDYSKVMETIKLAVKGEQIQPLLV